MNKLLTTACALAMGIAWGAAPAIAQESTKDKVEGAWDKTKAKTEDAWDKTKSKTEETWDKTKAKTGEARDKTKAKTEETWDKTKSKTKEMTGKVKDKLSGAKESASGDEIRSAQQALQDKGFNPGTIDGRMGSQTKAALKEFQQKNNLTVTGSLDAETRDRLLASSPPAASPGTEPSRTGAPSK
jgi:peptidoglycan hydrolase-like protein with peptidoglycan-binding domain